MVFHGHGHGWHCNFLHPEFLHCFVLHRAGEAPHYDWVVTDYRAGQPVIEQVADASYTVESGPSALTGASASSTASP